MHQVIRLHLLGGAVYIDIGTFHLRLIQHLILSERQVIVFLSLKDLTQLCAALFEFQLLTINLSFLLKQLLLLLLDPVFDCGDPFFLALVENVVRRDVIGWLYTGFMMCITQA